MRRRLMARYGLTIQKKFLFLILLVGLVPTVIGVTLTVWGTRIAFASAMGISLESRASDLANRVGQFGETLHLSLRRAVQARGSDLQALRADIAPLMKFSALGKFTPAGQFEVVNLDPDRPDLDDSILLRKDHFARFSQELSVGSSGYVEDINLPELDQPEGVRLAAFIFRAADGSLIFFFASGDEFVRQIRSKIGPDNDSVFLYSRNGYLLSSIHPPPGLLRRAGDHFDKEAAALVPGWFSVRGRESGQAHWHIVGYSVIPRGPQASAQGLVSSAWVVLSAYDMENFMGPQATVVWGTIFVALAWGLVLMGVSVVAARRVVGPVKTLRYQAEAMASGNLDARASVQSHDEIRDLAEAFNTMAGKLRESHLSLQAEAEENRLRAEHINVINEITKAVTQTLDIDQTFEILKRDLKGAIDYDGLWVTLTDNESGKLKVTHAEPANLLKPLRRGEVPLEFSFHGRALREGAASSGAIGPANDSDVFESGIYIGLGFASYLVAPLPAVGRILGTITVVSRNRDAYGEEETAVLASVARSVALAIELAELFERTRRFAGELELKVAERTRDLNRANQKLIQTEKYAATGRLAANLAHEINNPLNIIKNYLQMVTNSLDRVGGGRRSSDPNLAHISIINEEIDRIARIVRQLLDLHRPAEQKVMRTDICALLSDICALMEKDFAQDNIRLTCDFQTDLPSPMVAPDLIRQVFINLLRNAQDAMEGGGELKLKTEGAMQFDGTDYQRVIVVSISDTGTGIPKENLGRIFDPFFTTKTHDRGTGLGLSVSFGIIQMYSGSIEVFSETGRGTTMVVTIPVDPPPIEKESGLVENGPKRTVDSTPPTPAIPR